MIEFEDNRHAVDPLGLLVADGEVSNPSVLDDSVSPVLSRNATERSLASGLEQFSFGELDVRYDAASRALWSMMRPSDLPCFSLPLLVKMRQAQRMIGSVLFQPQARYFVCGSQVPDVYNLGGDLVMLAQLARRRDEGQLRAYGYACIDVLYNNYVAMNMPIITIGLVQGAALGGGFESVLSFDFVVAEKKARFGLPEVMFNMFPGMGAFSMLVRRVGRKRADEIINSGRIYSADEMLDLGVVDHVADNDCGPRAVDELIKRIDPNFASRYAMQAAHRRVQRIDFDELKDIVHLWVGALLALSEEDLRKMERISAAQKRRFR